ncbi:helix-turn-helix transcriptional regulator [Erwinia persicina]|uniref:helix-turn-helix transcriptional regulator n=1 Tax=Erwinia persicina TaxID=55211 RepID=UPI001782F660|nr:helix-turn-helix transcriptional regulator [Erwinia persicina]MBD8165033.1 helix-turn-helix transcriptional regulator [Erwinia persicina]
MRTLTPSVQPGAFIHECLHTITHLIPGASAVFYLVDSNLVPGQHLLSGISAETHQAYLQDFLPLDPLHPRRFNHQAVTLAGLNEAMQTTPYYRQFMVPNHMGDMMEIFVRRHKRIVAGLSIMRDLPFSAAERLRLRASLPLIELATEELLPATAHCRLTPKEQQIVGMVREGACNKRIARQLDVSLSTVKTHLRNIFAKTHVNSRTELAAGLGLTDHRDAQY